MKLEMPRRLTLSSIWKVVTSGVQFATQVGDTVFKIDHNAPDHQDPTSAVLSAIEHRIFCCFAGRYARCGESPPGFDAKTGEFWVGRFRCGSAIPAESSPYRITVQLLEDGQEIARRYYVIGVLSNPTCVD